MTEDDYLNNPERGAKGRGDAGTPNLRAKIVRDSRL
jgi:hypothetical protein